MTYRKVFTEAQNIYAKTENEMVREFMELALIYLLREGIVT